MAWLKMDVLRDDDNYDKLLRKDPKLITSDIIGFILYIKDNKKLSPATISAYIAALRLFYNMNDMEDLKWRTNNVTEDRP
jgi:integrase